MADISTIPIHMGSHIPIIKQFQNESGFHFSDGLGDSQEIKSLNYSDIKISGSQSPLKIIELVKKNPNEINLLCLGPLTNIATAFMLWPEIKNKLKLIYIMGGTTKSFGNHISTAEYNSAYDFISAKIVFENFNNLIITPWEPTLALSYSQEDLKEIKKNFEEKKIVYNKELFNYWEIVMKNYDLRNNGIGLEICDLYSIIPAFNFECIKRFYICDLDVVVDSRENVGMTLLRNRKDMKGNFKDFFEKNFNGDNKEKENIENLGNSNGIWNKKIVISEMDRDELHKDFLSIFTELV